MNSADKVSRRTAVGFSLAMGIAAVTAAIRAPAKVDSNVSPGLELDRLFADRVGIWSLDRYADVFVRPTDRRQKVYGVYDQVLERIYVGDDGSQVMLCVAYGGRQSDGLHVHRPEHCYRSAGFEVAALTRVAIRLADQTVPASRLHAHRPGRSEPITYWTVFGDTVENDPRQVNWMKLRAGMRGEVLDGMLVRVSSIHNDVGRAHQMQSRFADALVRAIDPGYRSRVIGA